MSPTSGIMISGFTFQSGWAFFTLIAARITALVCILAISGYVTARRHPRCPIIGLNSWRLSMIVLICSTVLPWASASFLMSSSSVGTNSWSGGSRKRIVTGLPSSASYSFSKSPCCSGRILASAASLSSSVSEQIISRNASILFPSKNICSVRQSPIPSAPSSRAFTASCGVSAFVRTFIVLYLSAHPIILPNSPAIVASTVGMIPS